MPPVLPNVFSGPYVDRRSITRKDAAAVAAALADPAARLVPVWRHRSLVRRGPNPGAVLLEATHALRAGTEDGSLIYLGEFRGVATFAFEVPETPGAAAGARHGAPERGPTVDEAAEFADLRGLGAVLPADEAGLLAYARALIFWRNKHRYCGACGSPMRPRDAGHVMACTDGRCGNESFPRIDPAIIVLVTDGDRALLGRQAVWPPGRYSTLAGFVEPGESLEDAVLREVHEESGVTVTGIEYHSSQPWPFPSSLMLGFTASAAESTITLNDAELEDARWFTRRQIAAGEVLLPPPTSVSYRLIEHWFNTGDEGPLADVFTPAWQPRD
jgi:NAD+ diphosphatase